MPATASHVKLWRCEEAVRTQGYRIWPKKLWQLAFREETKDPSLRSRAGVTPPAMTLLLGFARCVDAETGVIPNEARDL